MPSDLGRTLTHEHLSLDFHHFYRDAPEHLRGYVTDKAKISLGNAGIIRQYPYASRYNIQFYDNDTKEKVIEDLHLYKKWCDGNCTIVENTTTGIRRDLKFYREVAKQTGVNVIAGTGHYLEMTQESGELSLSIEQMSKLYTKEIVSGVDVSNAQDESDIIKCGFLGEIASNWPISGGYFDLEYTTYKIENTLIPTFLLNFHLDFEKRAIQASAEVQSSLGCGVTFHPGYNTNLFTTFL